MKESEAWFTWFDYIPGMRKLGAARRLINQASALLARHRELDAQVHKLLDAMRELRTQADACLELSRQLLDIEQQKREEVQ